MDALEMAQKKVKADPFLSLFMNMNAENRKALYNGNFDHGVKSVIDKISSLSDEVEAITTGLMDVRAVRLRRFVAQV